MKKSNPDLKFSTLKIKRIIQENKEIGKIANMTPYVICIQILLIIFSSKIIGVLSKGFTDRLHKESK
jgi:hypothetical protein